MKGQDKFPEKQLNQVETGNLPQKEFRTMTVNMNAIELAQSPLSEHGVSFLSAGPAFHQIVSAAQCIIIPILEKESDLPCKVFCLSCLQHCQGL